MSYNSLVLADSPAINLRHEDISGTTSNDSSGNANHGTYVGTPTLNQRSLLFLPHEGKSIVVGVGKRVTIPAGLITSTTYTYEFLIKPTSVTGVQCLAHDGTNGIYLNGDKLSLYYTGAHHDSTKAVVINEKSLLQVVVTAGAVEYFINRVSAGTAASAPVFSATALYSETGGANEIAATVCEFAAYTTAVLAAKIRERYRAAFKVGYHKVIDNFNPALHLTLSEDIGTTAYDISGNDNDFTIAGSPILADIDDGVHQSSLKVMALDGVDDSVYSDSCPQLTDGAFTVCAPFKVTTGGATYQYIFDVSGPTNNNSDRLLFRILSDNTLQVLTITADTIVFTPLLDVLYDMVVVANGANFKIYIDGEIISDVTLSTVTASNWTKMRVGENYERTNYRFGGSVPELILIDGILTAQQVKQRHEARKSRFSAEVISYEPVNYFRQGQASGNAIDLGSLGNDGVWTGSPTYAQPTDIITNEPSNKSIAVTTSESLAFTSIAASTTYSLLSLVKPTGVAGSQEIFTNGTDSLKLNGAKLGMFYSGVDHDANTTLVAGEAHLVGVSVDAGAATFNVDGVADGLAASATAFAPTKLYDLTYTGTGDEAAVFDSPLTPDAYLDIFEMASYSSTPFFGITGSITESLAATDFYVRASQLDTGTFIADAVIQGDQTYTFDFSQIAGYEAYADEVLLTVLPKTGKRRLNSADYLVGDYYIPADVSVNDHLYEVTAITTGTTAASEPVLGQVGGTTVDGGVTVQDRGACPTPQTQIDYAATL